jgi:Na+-driven multidrug efflux pump
MARRLKLILIGWVIGAAILGVALGLAWGTGRMPLIMFVTLLAFWGVGIPMRYLVWRRSVQRQNR